MLVRDESSRLMKLTSKPNLLSKKSLPTPRDYFVMKIKNKTYGTEDQL
jgi:hypothetical protein